ncbi:VOC family protein [Parvibaculum sp.]|uniref:VOC family protein n=1 Tax=Parvibaculum sp. TaxID=2024848 RepID=UPI002730A22C|nr:VOC family protein [Parvibaculum sp.]MDP1625827.1 VOC family protein [Parvibaculum sp.]MDP2149190.1 VOC family protein [Parvibaculum sp.]MDP3330181.1 VOC family protein [Parvibaculum sp.]
MIKVTDIAYVRFRAPDLDEMEKFLIEFGMVRAQRSDTHLHMRGTDAHPFVHETEKGEAGFVGLGFFAESVADLEKLAGEHGLAVEDNPAPGGGKIVRFTDPNGFPVDVVAGQSAPEKLPVTRKLVHNDGDARARAGQPLRVAAGPSQVKRLGHCVINVTDYRASEAWYKERFGLVTSDEIEIAPGAPLGAFLRCDRGPMHVDHHTLFLVGTGQPGFNHAAFEVAHFDDLMAGHQHLEKAGRRHEWGVGRHILGSQIFDYWRDPWGHTVEHWTDGDLFNNETPPEVRGLDELMGNQWGPDAPPSMGS